MSLFEETAVIFAEYDCHSSFFWNKDLKPFVSCSDIFYWATADLEPIETFEDLAHLRDAFEAAKAANAVDWGAELYAARRRKLTPQPMVLDMLGEEIASLFNDAAEVTQ